MPDSVLDYESILKADETSKFDDGMDLACRRQDRCARQCDHRRPLPACFPALASLGTAAGLSFLSEYEGLFIAKLLPLFAGIALLANALGWFHRRQWWRSALGMLGPALVLAAMQLFFGQWWTAPLLYTGLALMVGVSLWDLLSPGHRGCGTEGCAQEL